MRILLYLLISLVESLDLFVQEFFVGFCPSVLVHYYNIIH